MHCGELCAQAYATRVKQHELSVRGTDTQMATQMATQRGAALRATSLEAGKERQREAPGGTQDFVLLVVLLLGFVISGK